MSKPQGPFAKEGGATKTWCMLMTGDLGGDPHDPRTGLSVCGYRFSGSAATHHTLGETPPWWRMCPKCAEVLRR